jgi:drug/metabolite transporter (DMT)-like permease
MIWSMGYRIIVTNYTYFNYLHSEYLNSSIVFLAECLKLLLSCLLEFHEVYCSRLEIYDAHTSPDSLTELNTLKSDDFDEEETIEDDTNSAHQSVSKDYDSMLLSPYSMLCQVFYNVIHDSRVLLLMGVPSLLYVLQNNMVFVAMSNLPVSVFQVTIQMRILTTALFSILVLSTRISSRKWTALMVLTGGVAFMNLMGSNAQADDTNMSLGLICVAGACLISGFASVFTEKMLKSSTPATSSSSSLQPLNTSMGKVLPPPPSSLWVRNIQLAFFGVICASVVMFANDGAAISASGLLHGYSRWTWVVLLLQGCMGLVTAMVIRYADNIIKCFASAFSIALVLFLSVMLFNAPCPPAAVVGTGMVVVSALMYGWPEQKATSAGAGAGAGAGANVMRALPQSDADADTENETDALTSTLAADSNGDGASIGARVGTGDHGDDGDGAGLTLSSIHSIVDGEEQVGV